MSSRPNQLRAVALRELCREQPDRRQVQISTAQSLQDLGMMPRRPSGLDSFVGNPFCEVKHPTAVREHRGAAQLEVEPPGIDLAQVNEQVCLDRIATLNEFSNALD